MEYKKHNKLITSMLNEERRARNLSETIRTLDAELAASYNRLALLCWTVRENNFAGNAKKAAQWVRENTSYKDTDRISRIMAVGRMIAACSKNADIYSFVLNLPPCKNEVLAVLRGQVIRFVMERGEMALQEAGRDDLRGMVNTFLERGENDFKNRYKKRKPLKMNMLNEDCGARNQ